jgi:hypothetical protein
MNRVTTKLLAIISVIFVTVLVTLPYQNQVANAAPATKKYQVYVTLIDVPANAEDLIVNGTIGGPTFADYQEVTVSSPTSGDTVKLVFTVPYGTQVNNSFYICARQAISGIDSCELESLPSKGSSPVRVDYTYPQ